MADYLANLEIEQAGTIHAHNFYDLSSRGRKIINIDKQQIPALRIKTRRIVQTC